MNTLITGAGGFIGSTLMDALSDHWRVGFDNWTTGRRENTTGVFTLDITNRSDVYAVANELEPDVVIHCAASYSDPNLWHRDTSTNIEGAINVAAVAKHHAAHVIYFQTILPPVSSYAISKIAAEQYLRLGCEKLTVLRLANIYGPRNLSGPVPVFYKRLTAGQDCLAVDTSRDFVFIEDLVRVVKEVVEQGATGTFDVCSGKQTPIVDLFNEVADALGMDSASAAMLPPDPDDVQGSIDLLNSFQGMYPKTLLAEGIAKTVASYRETGVDQTHTHLRIGEKDAS